MRENVDGISQLWVPDRKLCEDAEANRQEYEWLRRKNGLDGKRPSELGIDGYRWGKQLHPKFFEGRTPPPVPLDSLENIEWYTEQLERCVFGFEYKGQRITGDHYWSLNFTPFLVAKKNSKGRVTSDFDMNFPSYSLMHDYLYKTIEEAHYLNKGFALMGGRGFGKEQPHYETIMTPDGESTMGEIQPGDYVIGSDGNPKKVLQKHPQGVKNVYRVHLSDGRYADCGLNHLWGVRNRKGKYKVIELKDLLTDYLSCRGDSKYFIETSKVNYKSKPVSINPYLLGLLIGDGGLTQAVRISTDDTEIVNSVNTILGENYSVNHLSNYDYSITFNENGKNPLWDSIKDLHLNCTAHHKFIPLEYKLNSEEVRLEVLRGLMDSDGTIGKNGVREFYSVSKQLAEDVAWIARSLGMKAVFGHKHTIYNDDHHLSYRVRIYSNISTFNLNRKKDREQFSIKRSQLIEKTGIVDIEKLPIKYESSCITIDSEDSLYLTKDFIQTHNTYAILGIIAKVYHLKPSSHGIVSASNSGHSGEAFSKFKTMIDSIGEVHPTISLARLTDTKFMIESGQEVTRDGVKMKEGPKSRVQQVIYGDNPGVTRGSRPDIQLMEEMGDWATGKGDLKSCIGASKGSWRVGAIQKCRVFLIGTGGSVASDQAKDVFINPDSYDLLCLKDFKKKACFFMPATYLLGGMGWEETAVNDNEGAEKWLDEERERTKSDMEIHTKLIQENPKTIEEAFRKMGTNIFNQRNIARQWSLLELGDETIKKPEKGFLDWVRTPSGSIKGVKWAANPEGDFEIIEHPYRGPNNDEVFANLYVGGIDSIDMGRLDSTSSKNRSKLACLIKKRIVSGQFFSQTSNLYVAKYIGRSDDVRTDYEATLKLSMYYNAKMNLEFTKINITSYYKEVKKYHMLLKRPSIALPSGGETGNNAYLQLKQSNLIGTPATEGVIDHQDLKIKDYTNDYCYSIYFTDVLEQLRDYQREDRTKYDFVIAMGLCELADEDMLGETASTEVRESTELKPFGYYIDSETGERKFGEIPNGTFTSENKLFKQKEQPVRWVDSSNKPRFDDNFQVSCIDSL